LDAKIHKKDEKSFAFNAKKLQKNAIHCNKKAANIIACDFLYFSVLSIAYSWLI
jgi:hypothetical protein